jgi:sulfur carrier protein
MAVVAMNIFMNDQEMQLEQNPTVAELLALLNYDDTRGLAVAVNDNVYPRSGWSTQSLHEGDRVTLIRAAAGG